MSSIKSLSAIAILFGAYLVTPVAMASAQAETFANGRSWYGVPNNPEVATRVVDVNSTDAINIECGETVTFRNGDKSFTWRFDVVNHRAVDILHFHDRNGPEVDIIVEQRTTGAVAGVEVKATMTPRAEHARHLVLLRDRLGDAFTVGVVMHLGAAVLPLGDRLWAVPVPALWTPW